MVSLKKNARSEAVLPPSAHAQYTPRQTRTKKKWVNLALKNYNIKRTQKNGWENGLLMIAVNSTVFLGQILMVWNYTYNFIKKLINLFSDGCRGKRDLSNCLITKARLGIIELVSPKLGVSCNLICDFIA